MKQTDLIKILKKNGYEFSRHGGNHDVYVKDSTKIAVPRHREVKEFTAKTILKEAGIK